MFETHVGPVEDSGSVAYLRPETAQGIFINFKNVLQFARKKPPFGIAQIGKSFRNEITPGNFIFRTREFEQMEMEFFVPPDEAEQWHEHWIEERDALVHRARHPARQPARCAPTTPTSSRTTRARPPTSSTCFPMGWSELEGIANRGDFDLTPARRVHPARSSSTSTSRPSERYVPHVIEPAAGVDRAMLAFLVDAYEVEEVEGRAAHRAAPAPPAGAGQGRRPAARLQGGHAGAAREIFDELRRPDRRPSTTRAARSASATAARTRSARPGASPSTARRWRTTPSPCATATPSSRRGSRSRASPTTLAARLHRGPGRARSFA